MSGGFGTSCLFHLDVCAFSHHVLSIPVQDVLTKKTGEVIDANPVNVSKKANKFKLQVHKSLDGYFLPIYWLWWGQSLKLVAPVLCFTCAVLRVVENKMDRFSSDQLVGD